MVYAKDLDNDTLSILSSNTEFNVYKMADGTPIIEQAWLDGTPAAVGSLLDDGRVLRLGESNVIAATGLRGGGKSLSLAFLVAKALSIGMVVFSNLNVRYCLRRFDGSLQILQSSPLDWNALYRMDSGLANGAVVIDELQYFADSRKSGSVKNQILNSVIMQVRKRQLDFYYSVKNMRWIDIRLRFETDFELACEDAHRAYPGQSPNKGEIIIWKFRELSGILTGHSFEDIRAENDWDRGYFGNSRREMRIQASLFPFWFIYDTKDVVSLEDAFTKVRLDLTERIISDKPQKQAEFFDILKQTVTEFKLNGIQEADCNQFAAGLSASVGRDVSIREIGKYRGRIGLQKKRKHNGGYYYTFGNEREVSS